jgi:hypothetical protein
MADYSTTSISQLISVLTHQADSALLATCFLLICCLASISTLKMEAVYSFRKSVDLCRTTWRYISEDTALQTQYNSRNRYSVVKNIRVYVLPIWQTSSFWTLHHIPRAMVTLRLHAKRHQHGDNANLWAHIFISPLNFIPMYCGVKVNWASFLPGACYFSFPWSKTNGHPLLSFNPKCIYTCRSELDTAGNAYLEQ